MVGRMKRVGNDFDDFVRMMQQNLEPVVGKRPSYTQVTNSVAGFVMDERAHERMIRRAEHLHKQRRSRGLF